MRSRVFELRARELVIVCLSYVEHIECVRINPALGCSPGHQLARWRPGLYGAFEASSARRSSWTFSSTRSSQRQVIYRSLYNCTGWQGCYDLLRWQQHLHRPPPAHRPIPSLTPPLASSCLLCLPDLRTCVQPETHHTDYSNQPSC